MPSSKPRQSASRSGMALPSEIVACCLFLASDEASFVTGAVLVADGGGRAPVQNRGASPAKVKRATIGLLTRSQLFCEFIEFRMRNNTLIKIRTRIGKGPIQQGGTNVENGQAIRSFFRKRAFRWSAGCNGAGQGQGQGWFHRAVDRGRFGQWNRRSQ